MLLPFILLVSSILIAIAWLLGAPMLRRRRRMVWFRSPTPDHWIKWLDRDAPFRNMPSELRTRVFGLMQILLREKSFVGCNGLIVTEEMRVVIAAYACLLVVNRPGVPHDDLYDELRSILVYPSRFVVHDSEEVDGLVTEARHVLAGQAWDSSRIILSWQDIQAAGEEGSVVLHEFAHYLDTEDGIIDGAPGLETKEDYAQWSSVFRREFEQLTAELDAEADTLLDPYAASEPAEFFAVVSETFFLRPRELLSRHALLYEQLQKYYRLDPASWHEQ